MISQYVLCMSVHLVYIFEMNSWREESDVHSTVLKAFSAHTCQSPEVTSKAVISDEEVNDDINTLTEKLSAALLNITAKEELVKQHAKVAEEAVSGWEKTESEVASLKQQLEATVQRNSALEDRVGHLDGALKECVRQLRQAREEHNQKIKESLNRKTNEWESKKSELENQLVELQEQLQAAKSETSVSASPDFLSKFEALEKENSALKLELLSRAEEVEIRILERDLSNQTAETASKQHLESKKKLAMLEAECRSLKAMVQKASPTNDHKKYNALSRYIEPSADSQSDTENRLRGISDTRSSSVTTEDGKAKGRNKMVPSLDINLMDDFLEMERLAAFPDNEVINCYPEARMETDKQVGAESVLKAELDALIHRTAELEEKLDMAEAQKLQLEMDLSKSDKQLKALQNQLKEAEVKLLELRTTEARKLELENSLSGSQKQFESLLNKLKKAEEKLLEVEKFKHEKLKLEMALDGSRNQLDASLNKLNKAEEKLLEFENIKAEKLELEMVLTEIEKQAEKSQIQLMDTERKLVKLQKELAHAINQKEASEDEVKAANKRAEMVESELRDVQAEIKCLLLKISSLEEEGKRERSISAKHSTKCQELQDEILKLKYELELQPMRNCHGNYNINQEEELAVAANKFAECQKTIASLGQQLKSLATMEDFLLISDEPM